MRAALAMLVVAVFGSAAYGQSCPINIAPDAQTAVSFGEPASSRFCGNTRKYHNDGTVEEAPTGGGCLNNPNARLTDLNAVEHAEIRQCVHGLRNTHTRDLRDLLDGFWKLSGNLFHYHTGLQAGAVRGGRLRK